MPYISPHLAWDPSYCWRCDRSFGSVSSLEQHRRASSAHYVCGFCDEDLPSLDDLKHHRRTECFHCDECGFQTSDKDDYEQHLIDDNVCSVCNTHFENANNLRAHGVVHLPKDLECYAMGCERMFATRSAMLIHLESGTCESGVDVATLHRLAAHCFQWKHYTAPGHRHWMLSACDRRVRTTCYRCPDVDCNVRFDTLSGLVQHAESNRCDEGIWHGTCSIGKCLRYIYKRT